MEIHWIHASARAREVPPESGFTLAERLDEYPDRLLSFETVLLIDGHLP